MSKHFYHGSTKFFTSLPPNTWVTSLLDDAKVIAAPWNLERLEKNRLESKDSELPIESLPDTVIFIYKIKTDLVAPIETGAELPLNWTTLQWESVELIEYYPSLQKLFANISNVEIKNNKNAFDMVAEQ
jgi:hypothetical protein